MIGEHIGAYRVLQQIGEGGMGAVYLAEHSMLGRRAALKLLHPAYGSRPEIVTRFFNEARAATAIPDPGIVQIFDFGLHTDGSAYIVMELLEGEPLDKRLDRVGVLPVVDALRIMRQVAGSLGAAHARGIVHRDLKPENIFLVPDPEVPGGERAKILDFGIAKLGDAGMAVKTQTNVVMGTPMFMSPEQCRGSGHVDQRSDIYSLGCVLMKLITGYAPFDATGTGELIIMHVQAPPPVPSTRVSGVAPEVDELVLRCLEKDPARRFASGHELAAELDRLLGRSPYPSPMTPALGTPVERKPWTPTTLSSASGASSVSSVVPASKVPYFVVGGIIVGLGAVALTVALGNPRDRRAATQEIAGQQAAGQPGSASTDSRPPAPAPVAPATAPLDGSAANAAATQPTAPAKSPDEAATPSITAALAAFATWAKTHPAAACPSSDDLGAIGSEPLVDPWGEKLVITCTDQPATQRIGVVSLGPDHQRGTEDDVRSWKLGVTVTSAVTGPRFGESKPRAVNKPTGSHRRPSGPAPRDGARTGSNSAGDLYDDR